MVAYVRKKTIAPTPTPTPVCPIVTLADIATSGPGTTWLLNANATILACQTLEIPAGQELQTNSYTLTNNGIINLRGTIRNALDYAPYTGNSVTTNNGIINVFSTGVITAADNGGVINNNAVINNNGDMYFQTYGIFNNNAGGTLNNNNASTFRINADGTLNNNIGGTISTNGGAQLRIYASATFINNGATIVAIDGILLLIGGLLTNNGTITNYSDGGGTGYPGIYVYGGILNNYGSINNMVGSDFTVNTAGTVYNYPSGTITNSSFIQFYMTNTALYNTGSLVNQVGAVFLYQFQARIYNYSGGVLTNNGTFNIGEGTGNIYNADGSGACGTGLINGTNSAGVVVAGATCP